MYKTHHSRFLGPLLEVEMSKKCMPLWREAHFDNRMYKTHQGRTILEVEMSKKCMWCEAYFEAKSAEGYGALLDVQMSVCMAGAGDCAQFQK